LAFERTPQDQETIDDDHHHHVASHDEAVDRAQALIA
jgi:hypothetical protein